MQSDFDRENMVIVRVPKDTDFEACTKWLNERNRWDRGHYEDWGDTLMGHRNYAFYPGQENIAMMFKLAWGGK